MSSGVGISWIAMILVVIFTVFVVGGVVALIVVLARKGKSAEGESGICGKCGYRVTGLTTFNCPECGSDLREVGIGKTNTNNGAMWALIIAGGLGALVLLCLCAGVFSFRVSAPTAIAPTPVPAPAPAVPDRAEEMDPEQPPEALTPAEADSDGGG